MPIYNRLVCYFIGSTITLSGLVSLKCYGEEPKIEAKKKIRPPVVLTERARKLHASALLIDGHNDLPWEIRKKGGSSFKRLDIAKPQPKLQTDIPRLKQGNVGGQFWSVWVPSRTAYSGNRVSSSSGTDRPCQKNDEAIPGHV